MSDDKPVNRRAFFRYGLGELIGPLLSATAPLQKMMKEFESLDVGVEEGHGQAKWLRPPGSLLEAQFRGTCSRHGDCVQVCPAKCIRIDLTGNKGGGLPYIEPDLMACVVCTGLDCMRVCPSGALVPRAVVDIDMGMAQWRPQSCVRGKGEACTICVDKCPLGSKAIEVIDNKIAVHDPGCIGCGLCQQHCPTSPKSIVVIPRSAR